MTEHLKDHQFKKGQSGNPGGRPKGTGISSETKNLTYKAINNVAKCIFGMSESELVAYIKVHGDELSRAEKVFLNGSKNQKQLDALIDRVIGKAPLAPPSTSTGSGPAIIFAKDEDEPGS